MAQDGTTQSKTLRDVRIRYLRQLPARVQRLEDGWRALDGESCSTVAERLYNELHGLKGSGATFGFPEISEIARELEEMLGHGGEPDETCRRHFGQRLARLRELADELAGQSPPAVDTDETPMVPVGIGRRLLIVDDDPEQAELLRLKLEQYGYEVGILQDLGQIESSLKEHAVDVILMDIVHQHDKEAGLNIISELRDHGIDLPPLIFTSARGDIHARLRATQAGGSGYFVKPVDVQALVDTLDRLVQVADEEPCRVMIVDDAASLTEYYRSVLEEAGMQVSVVDDLSRLLPLMSEFAPELILLDTCFGRYSGIDIAAMIRQDESWLRVPIVFLSGESTIERRLQAIRVGADDYLTKPIHDDYLVTSVRMRIRRYRNLRMMMERDSLTGLLDHVHIKERLDVEVGRALRQHASLVFAMLDIDHFKQINDHHGHAAGDRVIKNLSRMMTRRLRSSDITGRYGGEEFAVILPDTSITDATRLMDSLRERFSDMIHESEGRRFRVTFSCGLAAFPDFDHVQGLLEAADRALYRAKAAGRNRVEIATPDDQGQV